MLYILYPKTYMWETTSCSDCLGRIKFYSLSLAINVLGKCFRHPFSSYPSVFPLFCVSWCLSFFNSLGRYVTLFGLVLLSHHYKKLPKLLHLHLSAPYLFSHGIFTVKPSFISPMSFAYFRHVLPHNVATSQTWVLSTWKVACSHFLRYVASSNWDVLLNINETLNSETSSYKKQDMNISLVIFYIDSVLK